MVAGSAVDGEHAALVDGAVLMFGLLDVVSEAVSSAYLDEYKAVAVQGHDQAHAVVTALLAGESHAGAVAERHGTELADGYEVPAVHFPPHPDETGVPSSRETAAGRKLQSILVALSDFCAPALPLAILSPSGGTILIPDATPTTAGSLVARLSEAGGCRYSRRPRRHRPRASPTRPTTSTNYSGSCCVSVTDLTCIGSPIWHWNFRLRGRVWVDAI